MSAGANSSASSPTPAEVEAFHKDLKLLLGPWLFGSVVSSVLVGLLFVQTFIYYHRFGGRRDALFHQVIVGLMVLASAIAWATTLQVLNYAFIENWGSQTAMHLWPRTVVVPLLLPAFSALFSQSLFGHRVWKLSKRNRWVGFGLAALILCSLLSGFYALISLPNVPKIPINGSDVRFLEGSLHVVGVHDAFWKTVNASEAFLWISSATDTIICVLMVYYIPDRKTLSEGLDERTNTVLTRIMVLSITTGGITALFEVAVALIIIAGISSSNTFMGLTLQQAHIYGLVVVGSLNFRSAHRVRKRTEDKAQVSTTVLSKVTSHDAASPARYRPDPKGLEAFRLETVQEMPTYAARPFPSQVQVHSQVQQRVDFLDSSSIRRPPPRIPMLPSAAYTGVYPVVDNR